MFHVPITNTDDPASRIEFCHIEKTSARPETWKKGEYICLDNMKINVFVKGEFSLVLERERFSPNYGDFCVFSPHDLHYGSIPREMHIEYYQLDIGARAFDGVPGGADLFYELCRMSDERGALVRVGGGEFIYICERIEAAIMEKSYALAFAHTVELVSKMLRSYKESTGRSADHLSPRVLKVIEFIRENYSSRISIDSLAKSLGVSPSYLSRQFKREVGATIHEYVLNHRISESLKLLKNGSVAECAFSMGFADSSHYISTFKRVLGVTPMEYAKKHFGDR